MLVACCMDPLTSHVFEWQHGKNQFYVIMEKKSFRIRTLIQTSDVEHLTVRLPFLLSLAVFAYRTLRSD